MREADPRRVLVPRGDADHGAAAGAAPPRRVVDGALDSLLSPEIQASRRTVRAQPGDEPEIRIRLDQPLNDAVDAIERVVVTRALDRAHGNYENAAKLLGISRKGLFLKRRRWGHAAGVLSIRLVIGLSHPPIVGDDRTSRPSRRVIADRVIISSLQ
jgi:hypothetical protein